MRKNKDELSQGSITVFLALVFLTIFALLGTMVEVTRVKVCTVHARRTLRNAAEGLLTEYSRPLYDEYHLFFLEDVGKSFETSIAEYSSATLSKRNALPGSSDLYDGTLQDVTVSEKKFIGDDGGDILKKQIVSYMKRELAMDGVDALRSQFGKLGELESEADEIEQKLETEKEESKQSEKLLKLMQYVDGVACSATTIQGTDSFAKQLYSGKKRAELFGITEPAVWKAMSDKVVSMNKMLDKLSETPAYKKKILEQIAPVEQASKDALAVANENKTAVSKMASGADVVQILSSNISIINETKEILQGEVCAADIETLKKLWTKYDTSGIVFDYTGFGEKGGAENPMDSFSGAVSGGLMSLVMKKNEKISENTIAKSDHYNELYAENKPEKEEKKDAASDFAENEEVEFGGAVGNFAKTTIDDCLLFEYISRYFSSFVTKADGKENALLYEQEYLACGKKEDKKNLSAALERIFLLRALVDTTTVFSSGKNRETAYAAAVAVVGFTGLEPLIRFTQTLFLVLWGMAEATIDVAALLQQKNVPLIKSQSQLQMDFPELFLFGNDLVMKKVSKMPKENKISFGYDRYLMLLFLQQGTTTVCYRMMDLMECKIRRHHVKGFNLGMCVNSYRVSGEFSFNTKFLRLPIISDMLDRERSQFNEGMGIDVGYTAE